MTITDEMVERAWRAGRKRRMSVSAPASAFDESTMMTESEREFMRAALTAALGDSVVVPRAPDGVVNDILQPYRRLISETPALTSLLYDIDMLPEQTTTRSGAIRLAALCEVWMRPLPAAPAASQQDSTP